MGTRTMTKRVLLVGNPNCGKTTLFNALTGENQRIGNWPGVTVEQKLGYFSCDQQSFELIDLPGVYALTLAEHAEAQDARITSDVVARDDMDIIINVVDACHLERHLYLTSQLLELRKPMIMVLNMMDIATHQGIQIQLADLSKQLGCPVIALQAHRKLGLNDLKKELVRQQNNPAAASALFARLPQDIVDYFNVVQKRLNATEFYVYRWMEQSESIQDMYYVPIEDLDVKVADARYQMIHEWVCRVQKHPHVHQEQLTAKLDRWLLHRIWGVPFFLTILCALFFLAIGVGGAVQNGLDILSKGLFMQLPANILTQINAPPWLLILVTQGIGQSLNVMLTFLPVLAMMYFLLAFLEASGYMARVGFIMDRWMRCLGLPGQALIPMIVGFGCNVPAILAARSMRNERDRLLTILMNPYMSCSARLAIYAVFAAVFFPKHGAWVILSLYGTGILMAILTGWVVRSKYLPGSGSPLLLELPTYHWPTWSRLLRETRLRLWHFMRRAGRVIIPICVVLSALNGVRVNHLPILAWIGQWLMPLFAPMGLTSDNWPAVVALLTGMLAKEVVIATLSSLYIQSSQSMAALAHFDWSVLLQQAGNAIYSKLFALLTPFSSLVTTAQSSVPTLSQVLRDHFPSSIAAYAYLLFILLYIPCVSTMAVIRQEANRSWMWFSVLWSIVLAYTTAVIFYQTATWLWPLNTFKLYFLSGTLLSFVIGIGGWIRWRTYCATRIA